MCVLDVSVSLFMFIRDTYPNIHFLIQLFSRSYVIKFRCSIRHSSVFSCQILYIQVSKRKQAFKLKGCYLLHHGVFLSLDRDTSTRDRSKISQDRGLTVIRYQYVAGLKVAMCCIIKNKVSNNDFSSIRSNDSLP